MGDRLKKTAAEAGLPFGGRVMTYNSRLAQELGKWAEINNKADPFHYAVFRAYFVEGLNIGKIRVLADIAASVGLSGEAAEEVLVERTFRADVDADWELSRKIGITAVPTMLMNKDRLVGAQPYEMIERLIKARGIRRHKDTERGQVPT